MKLTLTSSRTVGAEDQIKTERCEVGSDWDVEASMIDMLHFFPRYAGTVYYINAHLGEVESAAYSPYDVEDLRQRLRRVFIGYMRGHCKIRDLPEPIVSIHHFRASHESTERSNCVQNLNTP